MELILEESQAHREPAPAPRAAVSVRSPASPPASGGIRPEVLVRVLEFIETRLDEPLHVEDLGRQACLSPFHFARMFKLSMGHAPHAYITMRRMERARQLLAEDGVAIAEIARKVGFRTQAHFSGVFRKQVGMTPGQYRRMHRPAAAVAVPPAATVGAEDVRL